MQDSVQLEEQLAVSNEDPTRPVFAPDGTDLTLIREMLSMGYEDRLRYMQKASRQLLRLQHAIRTS